MSIEQQKEEAIEIIDNKISYIKNKISDINNVNDEVLNKEIKQVLLDLVKDIKDIRDKDIIFYNDLIKTIPYVKYFESEIDDLNQTKEYLSTVIVSKDNNKNKEKFAELMKSSEIYYFINKKTKKEFSEEELLALGDLGLIKDYLQAIWPSAKQEELLSILLYINSGKATNDYLEYMSSNKIEEKSDYLYKKYKMSLVDLYVKNDTVRIEEKTNSKISSANRLDSGIIVDKYNKKLYIGFATSEYATISQQKQYYEKMSTISTNVKNKNSDLYGYKIIPTYLTNSLFNEHDLKIGQREHKKTFLNYFKKELTNKEKNLINCLSILSLAGNIRYSDTVKKLDVNDLLKINPYVAGANTLWIHDEFNEIQKSKSKNEKSLKFRSFLLKEANNALKILDEKLSAVETIDLDQNFTKVFKNIENILIATIENFNIKNMKEESIYNNDYLEKLNDTMKLYKKIHKEKFNSSMPSNVSDILGKNLYNQYISKDLLINTIEENNIDIKNIINAEIKSKKKKIINDKKITMESTDKAGVVLKLLDKINSDLVTVDSLKFFTEIFKNSELYPSRNINKLIYSVSTKEKEVKNYLKLYETWKNNNDEKFLIVDSIIKNVSNPDKIIEFLGLEINNKSKKLKIN